MSIPKRHGSPAGTYFLTSRTWEGPQLFKNDVGAIFIDTLLRYRDGGAYTLHAFVLMPDHFHLLLTPASHKTVERVMQYVKGGSAHEIGKRLNYSFPVWQRGFSDHRVRDQGDFEGHVQYIHMNPVRRRLVAIPEEYLWSSASRRYRLDPPPQRLKPLGDNAAGTLIGTAKAVP
jgi:putative transposase